MKRTKPYVPALAVLCAALIALWAADARAQAPPTKDLPDMPDFEEPEEGAGEAEPADEKPAEEETEAKEVEEEAEEEESGEAPAEGVGPAFGTNAQPPGTFPDPEPVVVPTPPPPEEEEEGGGAAAAGGDEDEISDIDLDATIPTAGKKAKLFQIQGLYELHFNVISDDHSASDWLSFYMLKANLNVTKNNQLSLRLDMEQRYVADPGESGLWFGDIRLYYSRKFALPIPKFPIPGKLSFYLTAPTSRQSQKRSYITKPTVIFALAPSLGPVTLVANGYFRYNFVKYAESDHQGTPNTMLTTGFMFQLIYAPLDWFAPSAAWVSTWNKPYRTRENEVQPWKENYYWELALNFSIPMPEKAPSIDISLAYAQGANVLEDGVYRLYFGKRDQSEIYLGLNMIY
ncbi:MAG: hypothetical protein JRG91_05125 [Deltaproteobacteria bacterium]|nr:hypothetical protein [Deltaproteobacteria bacterium]